MFPLQKKRLVFLLLLSAFLALHLPGTDFLQDDEVNYLLIGKTFLSGGAPYMDVVDHKPPLVPLLYGLCWKLVPNNPMLAIHLLWLSLIGLTGMALFKISQKLSPSAPSPWLHPLLLYAAFSLFGEPADTLAANEEYLVNFFVAFGLVTAPWASGILLSLATLTKQTAAVFLVLPLLSLWLAKQLSIKNLGLYLCGFVLPYALLFLWVNPQTFLFWSWIYPFRYISEGPPWTEALGNLLGTGGPWLVATLPLWWCLLSKAGPVLRFPPPDVLTRFKLKSLVALRSVGGPHLGHPLSTTLVCFFWLILALVTTLPGGRFFGHYFLLPLAPLCVLAASVSPTSWIKKILPLWFAAALALGVFGPMLWPDYHTHKEKIREAAATVATLTNPDDRIFVWGYEPLLYWYADRKPATRFLFCDYLSGLTRGRPAHKQNVSATSQTAWAWELLEQDWQKHPPTLVVDASFWGSHGYKIAPLINSLQIIHFLIDYHFTHQAPPLWIRSP